MVLQLQNPLKVSFALGWGQNPYWKLTKTWYQHAEKQKTFWKSRSIAISHGKESFTLPNWTQSDVEVWVISITIFENMSTIVAGCWSSRLFENVVSISIGIKKIVSQLPTHIKIWPRSFGEPLFYRNRSKHNWKWAALCWTQRKFPKVSFFRKYSSKQNRFTSPNPERLKYKFGRAQNPICKLLKVCYMIPKWRIFF